MKSRWLPIIIGLVVFVAALPVVVNYYAAGPRGEATAAKQETAYERVMRTGTLRCGYVVFAPYFVKDPNTGTPSGLFVDLMSEIGALQSFKVEWTEEASLPNLIESMRVGKIDAMCSGLWENAVAGKQVEFSRPIFFNVLGVYVRSDDHRFDHNLAAINDAAVKIAVIDGGMAEKIADSDFPKAQKFSIPELSDYSSLLLNVTTGKADLTISATHEAHNFLQTHPGTLRKADADLPIRVLPNTIFFHKGEFQLASMVNSALDEIEYKGQLEKIIAKYEPFPGAFYRVTPAFQIPQDVK